MYYYFACRTTPPTFAPSCVNWWCYDSDDGNAGLGVISTQLIGNGRGRLDYGICWGPPMRSSQKVTVYLNGNEISSVLGGGSVLNTSQVIEFDYIDSDILKIEESGVSIFQFNSFSVIGCRFATGGPVFPDFALNPEQL